MPASKAAYQDFLHRGGVAELSDRLKLGLRGADRVRYLNGQVTSHVAQLRIGHTQRACITTAKGRLCAEVLITATPDTLWIDGDASLRDSLPSRLERYIVADDVHLLPAPEDTRLLHFIGAIDPDALAALAGQPLTRANRFGIEGWDFWTTHSALDELWPKFRAQFAELDEPLLETLRIERGVPRWGRELTEETLPPEAGLERTHIDYHKGCYIGQEVISRLKSIGHVNRQLMGFSADSEPLQVGLELFSAESGEESGAKPVGKLTSVSWSFALEKPIALGYLKRGAPVQGLIARATTSPGTQRAISAQPLPFVS